MGKNHKYGRVPEDPGDSGSEHDDFADEFQFTTRYAPNSEMSPPLSLWRGYGVVVLLLLAAFMGGRWSASYTVCRLEQNVHGSNELAPSRPDFNHITDPPQQDDIIDNVANESRKHGGVRAPKDYYENKDEDKDEYVTVIPETDNEFVDNVEENYGNDDNQDIVESQANSQSPSIEDVDTNDDVEAKGEEAKNSKTLAFLKKLFGENIMDAPDVPEELKRYIEFHHEMIRNPTKDTKYLVYWCPMHATCGGIGNRLEGIVTLLGLAISMKRVFVIDWENPFPLINSMAPADIDWFSPMKQVQKLKSNEKVYYDELNESYLKMSKEVFNKPTKAIFVTINKDLLVGVWGHHLRPHFNATETTPMPPLFRTWLLKALFRPSNELMDLLKETIDENHMDFNRPYIGIHMRIGQIPGEKLTFLDPSRHSLNDLKTFERCAHLMKDFIGQIATNMTRNPEAVAGLGLSEDEFEDKTTFGNLSTFIASDVMLAKTRLKQEEGNVFFFSEPAFHTDRSKHVPWEQALRGDRMAWVELLVLAASNCVVASKSSFSWMAINFSRKLSLNTGRCWARFDHCQIKGIRSESIRGNWIIEQGCSRQNVNAWPLPSP